MSNLATLARPYAKAAFDLARSREALAAWEHALAASAAAVEDATMAAWLTSPALERDKAVAIIAEAAGSPDESFRRFLGVLAANDRLPLLPQVTGLYRRLKEEAENQLKVRVVSAIPLDDDQARRLGDALSRRYDCTIDLHNDVDATVLGGAVIYAGDEVIDGSLRGRLARLERSLV